jgi:hypothetical protein
MFSTILVKIRKKIAYYIMKLLQKSWYMMANTDFVGKKDGEILQNQVLSAS